MAGVYFHEENTVPKTCLKCRANFEGSRSQKYCSKCGPTRAAEVRARWEEKRRKLPLEVRQKRAHSRAVRKIQRKKCFICGSRGPCRHREIEVEMALMEQQSPIRGT